MGISPYMYLFMLLALKVGGPKDLGLHWHITYHACELVQGVIPV